MALKLIELVGAEVERPFSPYCWRIRMALAHKQLEAEFIPWRFTEKHVLGCYGSETVPILIDNDEAIVDSWRIANYLETTYPERPSLFGGESARGMALMLNCWTDTIVLRGIFPIIATDIHRHLGPADQVYFRKTREARLGKSLEEVARTRESNITNLNASLAPLRSTLAAQAFLGGTSANYADYIIFSAFQWARTISPLKLLTANDPIFAWRERLLDAFDGLARKSLGYET